MIKNAQNAIPSASKGGIAGREITRPSGLVKTWPSDPTTGMGYGSGIGNTAVPKSERRAMTTNVLVEGALTCRLT
jgi:hypothetical protein